MAGPIEVEVVYALPDEQRVVRVQLADGADLRQAIERSGLLGSNPGLALDEVVAGVFGRVRPLNGQLRHGDRVEIYRRLLCDPGTARLRRARQLRAG